ncbi:TMV resistance protein N-like [Hibiscus syriacus]|uniref:TMV resistance protein N-like n=1 Tax=Hibiscus syriacus TaxID=106335 RepID=A0A6A2ZVP7_HIBSY|nr:TMV resistance protein N-like [Hibiscus syriacus]
MNSAQLKKMHSEPPCSNPNCFFCTMREPDPSQRRAKLEQCFKEMPLRDDEEHVLVLSGLWNISMTRPDDPEFPSLGIFECMAKLIHRGITDQNWLLRGQNIYIPYYAAHIIGSYTMDNPKFAEKAVHSGVIPPLMELLRGKMSWVEQRVAVRALGHLASHENTFEAVGVHEVEVISCGMEIASTCLEVVYEEFVGIKARKRPKYHCDLLTRGHGGLQLQLKKAEEWASQLQCWSLHLLNCFACKERSLNLICNKEFLNNLCGMWGGLLNLTSPAGIGLLKTLSSYKTGRENVVKSRRVLDSLCNVSRSSDDWQNLAIDCLLLLLKDPQTRYQVIEAAALSLADLAELTGLGEAITQALLQDYCKIKYAFLKLKSKEAEKALEELWDLKVEKIKRDKLMSEQEVEERRLLIGEMKKQGNQKFWSGKIESACDIYSNALELCPLNMGRERIVLYSNRAQCHLLLKNPAAAISDTTRALCLSGTASPHSKSFWRRSQAYDMKGLGKESLMDCLTFINTRMKSEHTKRARIPYYAARMINKQMNATWIFANAKSKLCMKKDRTVHELESKGKYQLQEMMMMRLMDAKDKGLPGKPIY